MVRGCWGAEEKARQRAGTVVEQFGNEQRLLHSTTSLLTQIPVLPEPSITSTPSDTVNGVLTALARAHQQYVDTDPARFAAITHVTSTGIFGDRNLLPLLEACSRRTRATATSHLQQLQRRGLTQRTDEQLQQLAATFVDGAPGIELFHLFDRDLNMQSRAYQELTAAVAHRRTAAD